MLKIIADIRMTLRILEADSNIPRILRHSKGENEQKTKILVCRHHEM